MADSTSTAPRRHRALWILVGVLLAIVLLVVGGLAWLGGTSSGLAALLGLGSRAGLPEITAEGLRGRALGPIDAERLRIEAGDNTIELNGVKLRWDPPALRDRRLDVQELDVRRVIIETPQDTNEPLTLPAELKVPFQVNIASAKIGSLELRQKGRDETRVIATDIQASLTSDGMHHEVRRFAAHAQGIDMQGHARLTGEAPFALAAELDLRATQREPAWQAHANVSGTLERTVVSLRAAGEGLRGSGEVVLRPFAPVWLERVKAELPRIQVQRFVPEAPQIPVALTVDLAPTAGVSAGGGIDLDRLELAGSFAARNLAPTPLDQTGVPVSSAQGKLRWRSDDVRLTELVIALPGDARASGRATWRNDELVAELELRDVDLRRIDTRLKPTDLAGSVTLEANQKVQTIEAKLREPRFQIAFNGTREGERITVDAARITARNATLDASGFLVLDGRRPFQVAGSVKGFDPSAFIDAPAARLNGRFEASGEWTKEPQAVVAFTIDDSMVRGYPLAGRGKVSVDPTRVVAHDVNVNVAGNLLEARGAYGRPNDTLEITLDAPHLERLDRSLAGAVEGRARITGSVRRPSGELHLRGKDLRLPGDVRVGSAAIDARFAQGIERAITAQGSLRALDFDDDPGAAVQALQFALDGTRQAHAVTVQTTLAEGTRVVLAGKGRLLDGPAWMGTITSLAAHGRYEASLLAPVDVTVAPARVELGATRLTVEGAEVRIQSAYWTPKETGLVAEFRNIEPQRFIEAPMLEHSTVVLSGDANLRLGRTLEGVVRIARDSGDVTLPDEKLTLGLRRLEAMLQAQDGRVQLVWRAAGDRLGTINGQLRTRLAPRSFVPASGAPLEGSGEARIETIAWVAPLIDPNLATDGELAATFDIGGTVQNPQVRGRVRGERLTVAWLEHGIRWTNGSIEVALDGNRARLQRLEFASPLRVKPADPRIPVKQLASEPGRIFATGEYDIERRRGAIQISATRIGVLQERDAWALASGELTVNLAPERVNITGRLELPAAYWELANTTAPRLGDDVVVVRQRTKARARRGMDQEIDVRLTLGPHVYLAGRGLDARLTGTLRIRSEGTGNLRASGSIQTAEGTYDAYGQKLAIERGILNFQGDLENPGLNVRAVRRGIPLEAGVEILGTVQNPRVELFSNPPLPDNEKLAWIVLGRPAEQAGDVTVLASAAAGLFGGTGEGLPQRLARSLGFDDFTIKTGDLTGDASALPTSKVLGSSAPAEFGTSQILVLGRRISDRVSMALEHALGGEGTILRLTYALTRRLSLVARTGADNALDLLYTFAWD